MRWQFMNRESLLALMCRTVEAGVLTLALAAVILTMSPAEQGLFIAFLSFSGLLQLFDFGLSYAALQTSAHLVASGERTRLPPFGVMVSRLALAQGVSGVILVGIAGYFLIGTGAAGWGGDWFGPWVFFVVFAGSAQMFMPLVAKYEGSVSVTAAWQLRLVQESVGGCALIVCLAQGLVLWSLPAWAGARLLVVTLWFFTRPAIKEISPVTVRGFTLEAWRREIWPFQWKLGVSGITAFAILRSMTLIILAVRGPEDAGRFGLSLAIMNMLLAVTTVWPYSQARRLGALLAAGKMAEMTSLRRQITIASSFLVGLFAMIFCSFQYYAMQRGWSFAFRMGDLSTTILLLLTALVQQVIACLAVLLRVERRDPLLPVSILGGFLVIAAVSITSRTDDLSHVALAYLLVNLIGIPFVWFALRRFMRRHSGVNA